MKNVSKILIIFLSFISISNSVTIKNIKILESAENIRYFPQEIVINYLLHYKYTNKIDIGSKFSTLLNKLDNNLKIIALSTNDKDTKGVLEFLAYSRDQIDEIIKGKLSKDNVLLMLDYGETFIEGSNFITEKYKYKLSKEEEMLVLIKKIGFYINRATKYYIADNIGFNTETNIKNMNVALKNMNKNMKIINDYPYPYDLEIEVSKINMALSKIKPFLESSKDNNRAFIPMLVLISIEYIDEIFDVLSLYHIQNQ